MSENLNAPRPDESADAEVVRRLLARDEAAFSSLVTRYHGAMARVAGDLLRDPALVGDVLQETWLAVVNSLHRFEGRSSLKTWLFRILGHHAISAARKRRQTVEWIDQSLTEADPADGPERFSAWGSWREPPAALAAYDPEGQLLNKEACAALTSELEQLPPGQRAVVTLRDVEGLTSAEVCEMLQLSEANQRVLLHRGRARLRLRLEQRFGRRTP